MASHNASWALRFLNGSQLPRCSAFSQRCGMPWHVRAVQAGQANALTPAAPEHQPKGWAALHMVANRLDNGGMRAGVATMLLTMRADPEARTNRESTALHMAAATSNFPVVEVLLRRSASAGGGCDVNALNKDAKSPYDMCSDSSRRVGGGDLERWWPA